MYQLLSPIARMRIVASAGIVSLGLAYLYLSWTGADPHSPIDLFRTTSTLLTVLLFLAVAVLSRWYWVWRIFPKANQLIFPDIRGRWTGEVHSNWDPDLGRPGPIDGLAANRPGTPIQVTIEQGIFRCSIRVTSQIGTSWTRAIRLERHAEDHLARVAYLYEQRNPSHSGTDERSHWGAGLIVIPLDASGPPASIQGHYWTDRSWTKGLNTAGKIVLHRCDQHRQGCPGQS